MRRLGAWAAVALVAIAAAALVPMEASWSVRDSGAMGRRASARLEVLVAAVEAERGGPSAATLALRRALVREVGAADEAAVRRWARAAAWLALALLAAVGAALVRRQRARAMAATEQGPADADLSHTLEYLAALSHEIRTPVTSILGYTDVLCTEAPTPDEQLEYLETIRRNGDHLLAVVTDVLDLSRIEAGRMPVEASAVDPAALVLDVIDMVRGDAMEKGLSLAARAVGAIPRQLTTDPVRLRQIVLDLVSNAIRFTDSGGVVIEVGAVADGAARRATLHIDVVDSGAGVAEADRARLFEPWQQAMAGASAGSGLGLAHARSLARLLGGDVRLVATGETGSRFGITLPLESDQAACVIEEADPFVRAPMGLAPRQAIDLRGRVLVIEDGPDTRRLMAHFLQQAGCAVETAPDAEAGVEAWRRTAERDRRIDLVLLGVEQPGVDGGQVVGRLRASGCRAPILAVTAHGGGAQRARWLEAGCTAVLAAPVTRATLLEAVAPHLAPGGPAAVPRTGGSAIAHTPALATLVRMFVHRLDARVEEIEAALAERQLDAVGRLAHRLRGTADDYGLVGISAAAAELEAAARNGRAVERSLTQLRQRCREVRGASADPDPAGAA